MIAVAVQDDRVRGDDRRVQEVRGKCFALLRKVARKPDSIMSQRTRGVAMGQILGCVVPEEEVAAQGNDREASERVSEHGARASASQVRRYHDGNLTLL